jgi:hypothetical protein
MAALTGGFIGAQKLAWQTRSQELVSNVATALSIYIQREGSWPDEILNSNGNVNNEVCKVLQEAKLLDTTTVFLEDDLKRGEKKGALNPNSPERFGLFSPWGQRIIKQMPTKQASLGALPSDGDLKKHILQFRVDV